MSARTEIHLSERGAVRASDRAIKRARAVKQEKHKGRALLPSFMDHEGAVEALAEHVGAIPAEVQVKNSANTNGRLTLQRWDALDRAYLLVLGTHASRTFYVHGWLYGHEIARDDWRRPQGYWMVPTGWPLREWTGQIPRDGADQVNAARERLGLDSHPAPEQLQLLNRRAGRAHDRSGH